MTLKLCGRCNTSKPTSEFGLDRSRNDGLTVYCSECMSSYEPKRKNKDIKNSSKRCKNCNRMLPAFAFSYTPKAKDGLSNFCRTCKSYKKGLPTFNQVVEYEENFTAIKTAIVEDLKIKYRETTEVIVLRYRAEIEESFFKALSKQGFLNEWNKPEWIHQSSISDQ